MAMGDTFGTMMPRIEVKKSGTTWFVLRPEAEAGDWMIARCHKESDALIIAELFRFPPVVNRGAELASVNVPIGKLTACEVCGAFVSDKDEVCQGMFMNPAAVLTTSECPLSRLKEKPHTGGDSHVIICQKCGQVEQEGWCACGAAAVTGDGQR